jgi:hypothetical protein
MLVLAVDYGNSAQRAFDEFFAWVPKLLAFLAILLIGYIVAKLVGNIVGRLLKRGGFDKLLHQGAGGSLVLRVVDSPSKLAGSLSFWAVFLGALSIAVDVLGIQALEDLVHSVWGYIPNVIAAILIFVVAGAVAVAAAALADRTMGDTNTGRIVKAVVPVLVMAIATFMILDQLKIASDIVTITYAALIGAIALGMALAFGLGGREVAAQILDSAYERGQQASAEVKRDVKQGADRARTQTEEAKDRIDETPA